MSELGVTGDGQLSDDFVTIPDVPIQPASDRVSPNQVATGITRGTQTYMNTDGSYMTMGLIPNTTGFGMAFFAPDGTLISKTTSQTQYFYDKATGNNNIQIGLLPDGTYGIIIARSGYNVTDVLS